MASASGSRDIKDLAKSLRSVEMNTKNMTGVFGQARTIISGFLATLSVGRIAQMSDEVQLLRDRLTVITGSTQAAADVFNRLGQASQQTKTSITSLTTIYARLAQSTKETGISTDQLVRLTTVLQNTFRLSGATAAEATATAIQLSQGFASGELRGQELRSVLEQNVLAGEILSETFKVTRGELFKLAEKGMLNATKVIEGFLKAEQRVNEDAQKLAQTFGQTLVLATDKLSIEFERLNREFGISSKFAEGIDFLIKNSEILIKLIGTGLVFSLAKFTASTKAAAFAASALLTVFVALKTSILTIFAGGGGLAAITGGFLAISKLFAGVALGVAAIPIAIGAAVAAIVFFFDDIVVGFKRVKDSFDDFTGASLEGRLKSRFKVVREAALKEQDELNKQLERNAIANQARFDQRRPTDPFTSIRTLTAFDPTNQPRGLSPLATTTQDGPLKNIDKRRELKDFELLNNAFRAGRIDAREYAFELLRVQDAIITKKFEEGSEQLFEYNERLRELEKTQIRREFNLLDRSIDNLRESIAQVDLQGLNDQLIQGKITLLEYNQELVKIDNKFNARNSFLSGTTSFVEEIGTTGQAVAEATTRAFQNLETSFTEFIQKGRLDFATFTQGILDDLTRIVVRAQIIAPLAQGLEGLLSGGVPTGGGLAPAAGGIAQTRTNFFAKGGIVDSPSFLGFSGGRPTIGGEAGPEAVLPLTRSANGNLGVQASVTPININIVNNSNATASVQEGTGPDGSKTIEILIQSKVAEGIASGAFDRSLNQSFGLRRRGV